VVTDLRVPDPRTAAVKVPLGVEGVETATEAGAGVGLAPGLSHHLKLLKLLLLLSRLRWSAFADNPVKRKFALVRLWVLQTVSVTPNDRRTCFNASRLLVAGLLSCFLPILLLDPLLDTDSSPIGCPYVMGH